MAAPDLTAIPANLLTKRVRLWIDEDGQRGTVMSAGEFLGTLDTLVHDVDGIVTALLAGQTYRDGGGAEVEWTIGLADRVKFVEGQGWMPDHEAGCRADIAYGLWTVLADARAAFGYAAPGDVAAIVDTVRRQVASCMPEHLHNVEGRTKLLVDSIDHADLQNEAERLAAWVDPAMLHDAARFAVQPLRGRF